LKVLKQHETINHPYDSGQQKSCLIAEDLKAAEVFKPYWVLLAVTAFAYPLEDKHFWSSVQVQCLYLKMNTFG